VKNESVRKIATIRYAVSSRPHASEPCYSIDLSSLPGQSSEVLEYSKMIHEARSLICDGWEIRYSV